MRPENMEILLKLLKNIGEKLDSTSHSSKDVKAVGDYFKKIEKIKDDAVSKSVAKTMEQVRSICCSYLRQSLNLTAPHKKNFVAAKYFSVVVPALKFKAE